jgi:hypothetical protein
LKVSRGINLKVNVRDPQERPLKGVLASGLLPFGSFTERGIGMTDSNTALRRVVVPNEELEVLVSALQAFIFTILAAVYIGLAMHPEH